MKKFYVIFLLILVVVFLIFFVFKEKGEEELGEGVSYYYLNEPESIENRAKYQKRINDILDAKVKYSVADFKDSELDGIDNFVKLSNYLNRLKDESLRVNLNNIDDVARHSLKYKILFEKIEKKYGSVSIDNPYRYCTMMVSYANELWALEYSKKIVSKNYYTHSKKYFFDSYVEAENRCSKTL
jgi:hypothetical protein